MKSVFIRKIELNNYRQFIEQTIEFNGDSKGNIVIIQGENGFGKSNIYNAINWCFFGIEEHLRPDAKTLPICNSKLFKKMKPNDSIKSSVKITLDTPNGEKEIERKLLTYKTKADTPYIEKTELQIMELIGKSWKIAPNPEYLISRILPVNMRHFFFIDGEKLRQLFENIKPDHIKSSIFELSHLSLVQNAMNHLNYFKNTLRSGVDTKHNADLSRYQEYIEKLQNEIIADKDSLAKLKKDKEQAYINKKKLDQELEELDVEGLKSLEAERKGLEENINYLERTREEKIRAFCNDLFKIAPTLVIKKSINITLDIISKLESDCKLPPTIQQTFLEELLAKKECICGADLTKKEFESCKKKLEELLDQAKYSSIVEDTANLKYNLKSLLIQEKNSGGLIDKYEMDINDVEKDLNDKNKRLKEIKTKIGDSDVEKVRKIHEERENIESTIRVWDGKIGKRGEEIYQAEKKIKEIENLYNKDLAKKDKYKAIIVRINFCDKAIEQLQKVMEKLMDEIRREAKDNTRNYFSKLISSKNFSSPDISENYELIVEKDGFNAVTSLSAAETLCMGYSFMAALRKTSGFLAPIVIDTPLAKIDIKYRFNVADWLKNALDDAQVILLVTDAEYTKEFRDAIKSCVKDEFLIKHNKDTETSEVVPYGSKDS